MYEKVSVLHSCRRKSDGLGKVEIHPLQRIVGVFCVLGYGVAADSMEELVHLSEAEYGGYGGHVLQGSD